MLLKLKFTLTFSVVVCGLCTVSAIALHLYFISKETKKEIMAEPNAVQSCWIVTHTLWSMFLLKMNRDIFLSHLLHHTFKYLYEWLVLIYFISKFKEYSFKLFSKFAVTLSYRYIMSINYDTENESHLYIFPSGVFKCPKRLNWFHMNFVVGSTSNSKSKFNFDLRWSNSSYFTWSSNRAFCWYYTECYLCLCQHF